MAKLTTVFWRDIPAQVIVKQRRESAKRVLSERFAVAIDAAAMKADLAGTDAYLDQWRRVERHCGGDLEAEAERAAAALEAEYDKERLGTLVRNGGIED